MRFSITHLTRYDYSRPVFVEPQTFRLMPRQGADQRTTRLDWSLSPAPAGCAPVSDEEGNHCLNAWFDGLHSSLTLSTTLEVETLRPDPFAFLPEPSRLPLDLSRSASLARFLARADTHPSVDALAAEVRRASGDEPLAFALDLTGRLYKDLEIVSREDPGIKPPAETLASGAGACRDAAVLFMDCCRAVGLPSRYVSGYQEGDPDQKARDLHAWAEAFVPGGGWRGFDPTQGLAVADRHVALASAPAPEGAAPVSGSFRGTGATARLSHRISLKVEP